MDTRLGRSAFDAIPWRTGVKFMPSRPLVTLLALSGLALSSIRHWQEVEFPGFSGEKLASEKHSGGLSDVHKTQRRAGANQVRVH